MVWIARLALHHVSKHTRPLSSCPVRRAAPELTRLYLPEIASIAKRPQKIWQADEVDRLRDLYSKGHSLQEIADVLQRPYGSVKHKCQHIGARRPTDFGVRAWQPDEVDRLRDLGDKGYSLRKIADILQRSYSSVQRKRNIERQPGPTHKNKQAWRADEDDHLRELTSKGYSVTDIANILQRSYRSVKLRQTLQRDPRPTRAHVPSPWELPWTDHEISYLKSMIDQDSKNKLHACHIIAAKLHKSMTSVRKMMTKPDLIKPAPRPWTDEEIGIVKSIEGHGPGKDQAYKVIAVKLQRSVHAVREKMRELGLIVALRKWTEEELRCAIRMRGAGYTWNAISCALGRPKTTLCNHLRKTPWNQPLPIPKAEFEQIQQLALKGKTIDLIQDVLPHHGKELIAEVMRRADGPRARRWQKEELAILQSYAEDNKIPLDVARAATVRLPGRSVIACRVALRNYKLM